MTLYSIPPLLTLACFVGLAALTLLRGEKSRINFLFLLICILGTFLHLDILLAFNLKSAQTALLISRIDHFFIIYLIPLYIQFFHAYLQIEKRKWLIILSYAYAFILTAFIPTDLYIVSMQRHYFGYFARGGCLYPFFGLGGLIATVYILLLLYQSFRREISSTRRKRLIYVFIGFGVMGLMNSLNIFPLMGHSIYPPGNLSFIPLIVFGIGLFRHDLLKMGFSIKKSLVYSTVTALLTGFYALIVTVLNRMFKDFDFSDSLLFPVCFFFVLTFIFGPLKRCAQNIIDRTFYKGKTDYQKTIHDIGKMIVSVLDLNEIGIQLTRTLLSAMMIENCALFLKNSGGSYACLSAQGDHRKCLLHALIFEKSSLATYLRSDCQPLFRWTLDETKKGIYNRSLSTEPDRLHAEIILPLTIKNEPNGFLVIGMKRSGDHFSKADIDLLKTLSHQTALAIENARAYQKIEQLNKTLEQKVADRTISLKKALNEKEKTQELLVRSESLAAIGQLVAGVAHEINNPLTSVKSLIQTTIEDLNELGSQLPLLVDMIDDLRFADRETERARKIVASLLGLSRQTQTYTETVNLNMVIQDALRVLHNQHKYLSVSIHLDLVENLPEIQGNFANLGQVAINIIQNAIHAVTAAAGSIYLTTRYVPGKRQVVFECRDTGSGISDSIKADIFKPFFTTKKAGQGTGLGLYICHEIIRKHGGKITFNSLSKKGSVFRVNLPVVTGRDDCRRD